MYFLCIIHLFKCNTMGYANYRLWSKMFSCIWCKVVMWFHSGSVLTPCSPFTCLLMMKNHAVICHFCPFSQVGDGFLMKSGISVEGVTPEMLHSFCEDFLVSGTCYLRLRKLVERNLTTGNHMQEALMFQVRLVAVCFTSSRSISWCSWRVLRQFLSSLFCPCSGWSYFMNCRVQPVSS